MKHEEHNHVNISSFFHVIKTEMAKLWPSLLKEAELSEIQAAILFETKAGNIQTISKVAEQLNTNQGNFSAICKKMEKSGLIIRKRSTEDERVVLLELTELGEEKVKLIQRRFDEICRNHTTPEQFNAIINGFVETAKLLKRINSPIKNSKNNFEI
ncbi:MAG: MarR family winged helix-turn-helix transcriptional regulator [Oscillospiraceae bacterium]|nr:MarR family winged helix-turn-helix transcriptional regulator [Oscillospiraceae bacterium]